MSLETKVSVKDRLENTIRFEFFTFGNYIDFDTCHQWFQKMVSFKPRKLTGDYPMRKNYGCSWEKLQEIIHIAVDYSISTKEDMEVLLEGDFEYGKLQVFVRHSNTATQFSAEFALSYYLEHEAELKKTFEEFFISHDGIVGYLQSVYDSRSQNARYIDEYIRWEIPLDGIKYKLDKSSYAAPKGTIDPECLPGRIERYYDLHFYSCYGMWFGPDYYRFISHDTVASFHHCYENTDLGNGFRRIYLHENILDFAQPKHRKRQKKFRKHFKIEERIKEIYDSRVPLQKDEDSFSNPNVEIFHNPSDTIKLEYREYIGKYRRKCKKYMAKGYWFARYMTDGTEVTGFEYFDEKKKGR